MPKGPRITNLTDFRENRENRRRSDFFWNMRKGVLRANNSTLNSYIDRSDWIIPGTNLKRFSSDFVRPKEVYCKDPAVAAEMKALSAGTSEYLAESDKTTIVATAEQLERAFCMGHLEILGNLLDTIDTLPVEMKTLLYNMHGVRRTQHVAHLVNSEAVVWDPDQNCPFPVELLESLEVWALGCPPQVDDLDTIYAEAARLVFECFESIFSSEDLANIGKLSNVVRMLNLADKLPQETNLLDSITKRFKALIFSNSTQAGKADNVVEFLPRKKDKID